MTKKRRNIAFGLAAGCLTLALGTAAYGGKIGVLAKWIDSPLLSEGIQKIHREVTANFHAIRVDLPSTGIKDSVKSTLTRSADAAASGASSSSTATTKRSTSSASSKPRKHALYVQTDQPGASVRFINTNKTFKQGMLLQKGRYYIEISKEGYRTKRTWVNVDGNKPDNANTYSISLDKKGLPDCENSLELSSYNSGPLGVGGRVLQSKALFRNTNIHDLYLAYSLSVTDKKYMKLMNSNVTQNYAEFYVSQPSGLSEDDIKRNRFKDIDEKNFVTHVISFEQRGNDSFVVNQALLPGGLIVLEYNAKWLCENEYVY